jgi:hypothetical protein
MEFWSVGAEIFRAQYCFTTLYTNKSLMHGTPCDSNEDLCFHTAGGPSFISATDVSTEELMLKRKG